MFEPSIEVPQHVIYFFNLIKINEIHFAKKAAIWGLNINDILILLEIYANEGTNQIDITKRYFVTEASISQTTKKLLKKELIEKKIDPENNSRNLLFITERGHDLSEELLIIFRDLNNAMIKGIPWEDLLVVGETMEKINENCRKLR
jgi:DNA-binding MarR family transcriptional regulator